MSTNQHRVFFALWPSDRVRDQINSAIQSSVKLPAARLVPRHNWHITLDFIGNVSDETLSCLSSHAANISLQPFEITLDRFDYWPKPRVAWLGCQSVPDALLELVHNINTAAAGCECHTDDKVFTPHMTLLRNAKKALPQPDGFSVSWLIDHFVLVESELSQQGSCYRMIKRWPAV